MNCTRHLLIRVGGGAGVGYQHRHIEVRAQNHGV